MKSSDPISLCDGLSSDCYLLGQPDSVFT